jgi:hypothetical protein
MRTTPAAGKWLAISLVAVGLLSGVVGLAFGALLFPRTEVVEKPVEVVVEKRVEVPVEKKVVVERKVELPPPPFRYQPAEGGERVATSDEIKVALLMRDDIRKSDAAENLAFEAAAIFNPGKKLKVLVNLNPVATARLSGAELRKTLVDALEHRGFTVLADDAKTEDFNTLVHLEVDLVGNASAGRVAVTVRQGMLGYSNRTWRKVSMGVAHYGWTGVLDGPGQSDLDRVLAGLTAEVAADLAKAK